jgi:WD40 repeat protein/serine/threonine protein kinase
MKSEPPREEALFQAAAQLSGVERASFLNGGCYGDAALRQCLDALLAVHDQSEGLPATAAPTAKGTIKLDLPEAPDEAVGRTIGRYKVLEKVGEGGCGVVYVAEQTEPVRRRVALKVIKLGMDSKQVVARFEAERQALAMMDHPNIAKVLDAGATENGRPYFVMELVRGIRITDYCDQNNLTTKERLDLFIRVCQAIQHAHQKGIIHRDIKPSNILVTLHDGVPVPKVIDFGIAKATEGRLTDATIYTQLNQFIGTPAYMSPEQAEMSGLDIDTRSDIYSLGVLLYELLAGSTPFEPIELMSMGIDAMRKTIREKEPPRPSGRLATLKGEELTTTAKRRSADTSKLLHQLKGDLDWIVMKCLEKDRTRRYETANGLAADLKRHLNNEPVVARPPSKLYEFQKTVRRHKVGFAATAAIIVALGVGVLLTSWQAVRAMHAKREALASQAQALAAEQEQSRLRVVAQEAQTQAEANAEKFRIASIRSRRSQYAADVFAATTEIEKGSYVSARSFLRDYFPRESLEELRGFEWRYWWQLSAGQQLRTIPITGRVVDLAWSPDGRLVAEANDDGTVKLLHSDTWEVASILTGCSGWNGSIAFSFDGQGLATASQEGVVRFWSVRDGRLIFTLTNNGPRVACSPSGPLMAIGTGSDWWGQRGEEVHLVDTKSGQELRVLPKSGDRAVFAPDGKRLATANWGPYDSGSQAVILWDVDSGQKLSVLENMPQVLGMAFSRDGNLLAIGTRQGEVSLWSLGDLSHAILRPATKDFARSVSFSPDGRWLAVAMLTQEVEIWDVRERRLVEHLRGHTSEVTDVAYSPDGTQLASGCLDGTIRLWNPHPPSVQELIPEVGLWLLHPRFSPDSRWLAAGLANGDVRIVDPTTAAWNVRTVLTNAGLPMAFSGDAATLLTLATDLKSLCRWNATSGALLSTTALNTTNTQWGISATTANGSHLALAMGDLIEVFETRTGRCLDHFKHPVPLNSMEFSPDGQLLAICAGDTATLWDIGTGRVVQTLAGHSSTVSAIRFSSDQKVVATTSWDNTARLWDAATGKRLAVLTGHRAGALNCVFSPDGRTLVTGSDDRTIKFWNLATFREVASIQLNAPTTFLAFSPDGQILTANLGKPGLRCWRAPLLAEINAAEAKEKAEIKQP